MSYSKVTKETNSALSTVAYHAKKLGINKGISFIKPIYDWKAIQEYYDLGFCNSEVNEHFNLNVGTLRDAIRRGIFKTEKGRICKTPRNGIRIKTATIFVLNSPYSGDNIVRKRIVMDNLIPYICIGMNCSISYVNNEPSWANSKLILHLDHINGIRNDNRLENLRWLCPNCHSQTETYCGRNIKRLARKTGIEPVSSNLEVEVQTIIPPAH